ncbi:MAG TPA: TonB-dependent receptor, partial [Fimbriimonas sp.]|nr:TonB-dependent receptor [Fimbriimonas sp.]
PYYNTTLFAFASYTIRDDLKGSLELNYGQSRSQNSSPAGLTSFSNITIRSDNAYLPAAIATRMATLGIPTFTLGTTNTNNIDFQNLSLSSFSGSVGVPLNTTSRELMRGVGSLEGDFNSNWSWRGYYQHGLARVHLRNRTLIVANFNNAIDAITVTSANQGLSGLPVGSVACRSSLADPKNGCKPLDIFGEGVASKAAIDYVNTNNDWETYVLNEDVASIAVQGLLPMPILASPLAIAFGSEYRKEGGKINADPGGLAKAYSVGNFTPFSGQYYVTEGFLEGNLPIVRDGFVRSLDFNAAGRITSYSTSGVVQTWKLGLTSQVTDDFRLRSSWSMDVRAPNLAELFNTNALVASGSAVDPHTGTSVPIYTETTGNPGLEPEEAFTFSAGAVVTPAWIAGLNVSLDWYSIDIKRAIFTTGAAQVLQQCNNGVFLYCSQLLFNGTAYPGALGTIISEPLNASSATDSGLDFQADYTNAFLNGNVGIHLIGNYTDEETQTALGNKFDYAGSLGPDSLVTGEPKFRVTLSATYRENAWQATIQGRFIGSAKLNNAWVQGLDVDDNHVPSTEYLDLRGSYRWNMAQIYFDIDNVLDTPPPSITPSFAAGLTPFQNLPTRADIYDALGRSFRFGVRFAG